ncbi:unnamed protein product [Kuraishia capsulata CBS 1993]|uniref:C2H2-type domain-containing protein n=1 Tax=Kuraishia capsulata CBS 1993 TaxID=1382522 RepID=W6MKA7_9ASCO|nr:uncharacterized protein KUCA_T00001029001 [Kuraishia capsulata CBS 1993]CDK25062.1 unnamed protein product [Kuraishia capsulata CBS 1993]
MGETTNHHHHVVTRVNRPLPELEKDTEEHGSPPQHHHHVLEHSNDNGQVHHHLVHHGLTKDSKESLESCDWNQFCHPLDLHGGIVDATVLDNFLECCYEPHRPEPEISHLHEAACALDCDLSELEKLLFTSCPIASNTADKEVECNSQGLGCTECDLNRMGICCSEESCGMECDECSKCGAECEFEIGNQKSLFRSESVQCQWEEGPIRCRRVFATTGELHNHIVEDHIGSGKSQYQCRWAGCSRHGRTFAQKQKAVRHILVHSKDKPFGCPSCNKTFSTEVMLEQHVRTHTGERPFVCGTCGKQFKTSSSLCVHTRIHTGDRPIRCKWPGCTKSFNDSSNLSKHYKTHSRKFKCGECLKSFHFESDLASHYRMRHYAEKVEIKTEAKTEVKTEVKNEVNTGIRRNLLDGIRV